MISLTLLYVFMAAKWQHVTVIVWGSSKSNAESSWFQPQNDKQHIVMFSRLRLSHVNGYTLKMSWSQPKSPVQTDATLLANNSRLCWMLHVVFVRTPYCMLLRVVAQSLKPVKLLAMCQRTQQLPTLLGQQYWELLRPFERSLCKDSY